VERPGPSADALSLAADVAREANLARLTLGGEMVYGARPARVRLGPAVVDLPAGAFLQATVGAEAAMGDILARASAGSRAIADLYCGVGTFTFALAQSAPVLAVDASPLAVAALASAVGGAGGLKAVQTQARDLERRPVLATELARIDFAVFDPPRAGAAAQAAELARSKVARVAAVSCNLTTFLRDAQILAEGGYRLEGVHVVDQFLWSPHIELVALFTRT
jgi:23S rRNA (uracil1939-C5)-methyltransferase